MSVVVGVDAGGSSTRALASVDGAQGELVREAAANLRAVGVEGAATIIARAIAKALDGASADAIHVGIAGGGRRGMAAALAQALRSRFPSSGVDVSDDARIALRAGVPSGDAVALISGTGSIAYAEIGDARFRAGGFGHAIGDGGSGAAIGSAALNLALRSYDGRTPREPLFDRLETALGSSDPQAILDSVYGDGDPPRALAALAPLVLSAAANGERSATRIVQTAALELYELVKSVVRSAAVGERDLPLVLAGGMLASNSPLTFLLETRIASDFPHLSVQKASPDPVYGALALARAASSR
ncbi:MAG TPA: BadF/BadG/BcrA/BcrD ATPase family protein [Candidatus Baltobacteraceae bacterium]|nr:BadF/BadG/BcrA/BcrD ATPase family protein [Candidatus Baltobacteraceae bacterium]